jgi:hypothetical protein
MGKVNLFKDILELDNNRSIIGKKFNKLSSP